MKTSFLIFTLGILIFSCKKGKNSSEEFILRISPKSLVCGSNDGTRVRLFATESDYQTQSNAIRDVYSVGDNPVEFTDLEGKIYYFQCFKGCGSQPTANNFCDPSIEVYKTNGSLTANQPQEIEVKLCN